MPRFRTLDDIDVAGRTVLVRADLNVPMQDGAVSDATRIERLVPTVRDLRAKGAKVVLLSHFGRPKGGPDEKNSLKNVLPALSRALGLEVAFAPDCTGPRAKAAVDALPAGGVLLLENTRFHEGEEKNDGELARGMAALGDVYVNDAFSAAHRAHASTEGIAHLLPAAAGRLMQAELEALGKALEHPERPVAALVGGAKVSTKLELLMNLVAKVDLLVLGGGMANTFLAAAGTDVGASLQEKDMHDQARAIAARASETGCRIFLPSDAVVASKLAAGAPTDTMPVARVPADRMILDIGPQTARDIASALEACRTVVWNGPMGAFEVPPFDAGTMAVAKAVARLTKEGRIVSVAGGGDTVAALARAGVEDDLTYVSAAGGAFLEWMEGKTLPGVAALEPR
jgi:phosphoglycerate kinase